MVECFLVLLTKFVPLLVLFLLCQLHSGTKSQTSAQIPYGGYKAGVAPVTQQRLLPPTEVYALSYVLSQLELTPAPYVSSLFCDQKPYLISVTISCTLINSTWHISGIIIQNARLSGVISEDVIKLQYLQQLDLSNNKLHGSIPSNIGNLSYLTTLDLSSNELTGSIPWNLGSLKNLKILRLKLNFLTDTIPRSLGELLYLEELDLWSNKLSGVIPRELGDLTQLRILRLDENELSGTLPKELGKLSKLVYLWLASNKLTGELPEEYSQLKSLQALAIGGNDLSGRIPPYIAKLDNLVQLYLLGNNFEGEVPREIFNIASLQYLAITDLRNTGFAFPDSANLPNIYTLIMRNCKITGQIPSYIGNWSTTLRHLDLSFNNLTGGIPGSFEHLNLYSMLLTSNMLNGTIPPWIDKTIAFSAGDLSENKFTLVRDSPYNNSENVKFPELNINIEPQNRTSLYHLMDDHCHGKKSKYHSLFINAGGEATTIGRNHYDADNTTSKFYVNQESNWAYSCSGAFFSATTNYSDLIKNITCGVSVPEAPLYEKARLCPQSLTYYGYCLHNGNYTVKLHFAEILFSKDEDHSVTGKRVFDVYIQGKPVLNNFNIKEKAGGPNKIWTENFTAHVRDNLLEIRLFWAGKGSAFNPPALNGPLISAISVTPNFKVGGLSKKEIAGIVIAAVLAPFLLLAFMWRMGWIGDRELRLTHVNLQGKSYSLKEVKDATGNFSLRNEIGRGRFGIVYKATLPDKKIVAVKKLFLQSKVDRIGSEVYAAKQKQLEHGNLVKLLDVCSKKDLNLIIYEYMDKGSLKQALFGDSKSEVQLDWKKRVDICLGIARGLEYLHEDENGKIVHRDVKASNILLDGAFKAKVSDLGLAKLYDEEDPYKFIHEIGTGVNMAPEYATRKDITDKIDVYSYGIVVLEIISGKSNSKNKENQENTYLLNEACVLHSKKTIVELVDESLTDDFDRRQAVKILDLAINCVTLSPTLRPTMSQVVTELEQIAEVST